MRDIRNQNVESEHSLNQVPLRVYSATLDFTVEIVKGDEENEASESYLHILSLKSQIITS